MFSLRASAFLPGIPSVDGTRASVALVSSTLAVSASPARGAPLGVAFQNGPGYGVSSLGAAAAQVGLAPWVLLARLMEAGDTATHREGRLYLGRGEDIVGWFGWEFYDAASSVTYAPPSGPCASVVFSSPGERFRATVTTLSLIHI